MICLLDNFLVDFVHSVQTVHELSQSLHSRFKAHVYLGCGLNADAALLQCQYFRFSRGVLVAAFLSSINLRSDMLFVHHVILYMGNRKEK